MRERREEQSNRPERALVVDLMIGVAAGLAGTAAMSLSQRAEMALSGRKPSASPALAVCKLLGFETRTSAQEQRLAEEMHWVYGTAWGVGHSALSSFPEPVRSIVYMGAVWSAGALLMDVTGIAPPPTEWKAGSLITDLTHHAVYTAFGALVFHALHGATRPKVEGRT